MTNYIQGIIRIGVNGHSAQKFDENEAKNILHAAFEKIKLTHPTANFVVVSGLTNLGVPKLAYEEAKRRGWRTAGIACKKATKIKCFPCDEIILRGEEWGEESQTFMDNIDVLVKIGGGNQSNKELSQFAEQKMGVVLQAFPLKAMQ